MYNWFWDFYQQRRIDEIGREVSRSSHDTERAQHRLEDRIDRMALINTAMWELVVAKLGITQEEIEAKLTEVDMRDGVLDGRIRRNEAPAQCSNCGRTLMQRHRTCLYCGQLHVPDTSPAV